MLATYLLLARERANTIEQFQFIDRIERLFTDGLLTEDEACDKLERHVY